MLPKAGFRYACGPRRVVIESRSDRGWLGQGSLPLLGINTTLTKNAPCAYAPQFPIKTNLYEDIRLPIFTTAENIRRHTEAVKDLFGERKKGRADARDKVLKLK